jgi:cell division protein FtsB
MLGYISAGLTMLGGVINTLELKGKGVRIILAIILVATGVISMLAFNTTSGQRNEARGVVQGADSTIAKLSQSVTSLTQQLEELRSQVAGLSPEKQEELNVTLRTAKVALTGVEDLRPRIVKVLPQLRVRKDS